MCAGKKYVPRYPQGKICMYKNSSKLNILRIHGCIPASWQSEKGYVNIQIEREMYGLPQAGTLINKLLQQRLAPYGYNEVTHTHYDYGNMYIN